jgi:chemotaxis methyl-accepting protein methylase
MHPIGRCADVHAEPQFDTVAIRFERLPVTPPEYEYLRKLLRDHSGLDLSDDKQYLIESRLLPLLRKAGIPGIAELVQKVKGGSTALTTQVVEAMTTNETFFFRDKSPFDHFRDSIMPEMLQARASRRSIRIWCAAGSTGQEPYSLAICLKEISSALTGWRVEILASDISQEVIEKSKAGMLIYFDQDTKIGILNRLARTSEPDGFLVLGAAETVVGLTDAYKSYPDRRGLYRPSAMRVSPAKMPSFAAPPPRVAAMARG